MIKQIRSGTLKARIVAARQATDDRGEAEQTAWDDLSIDTQRELGRIRFHQLFVSYELDTDLDQLSLVFDDERLTTDEAPLDLLEREERRAERMILAWAKRRDALRAEIIQRRALA